MIIKEINKNEFDEMASNHVLGSLYQTSSFANAMKRNGFQIMYIAAYKDDQAVACALILTKTISLNVKYGYSPRGFLIDYFDTELLKEFTIAMKKYFNKRGFAFIKINPLITLSEVDTKTKVKSYSKNAMKLIDTMEELDYKKLKNNIYFESSLPKYNPIVNLKNFDLSFLDSKLQDKLNHISNKGLNLIKGDFYNINLHYELVKKKDELEEDFFKTMYKSFDENKQIDLFLLEIDYHDYLLYLQDEYATESVINEKINKIFLMDPKDKNLYKEKMNSDKLLNEINVEMASTSLFIQKNITKKILASAIVIKHNNVATFYSTGFDKSFSKLLPNHYLHYALLNHYKNENFVYADLNGITGDFNEDNPYKGLNEFKMIWNPRIFEYIGEFDLVINPTKYSLLWTTKTLHREFDKKGLKNTDMI